MSIYQAHEELNSVGIPTHTNPTGEPLPLWYRVSLLRVRMEQAEAKLPPDEEEESREHEVFCADCGVGSYDETLHITDFDPHLCEDDRWLCAVCMKIR